MWSTGTRPRGVTRPPRTPSKNQITYHEGIPQTESGGSLRRSNEHLVGLPSQDYSTSRERVRHRPRSLYRRVDSRLRGTDGERALACPRDLLQAETARLPRGSGRTCRLCWAVRGQTREGFHRCGL